MWRIFDGAERKNIAEIGDRNARYPTMATVTATFSGPARKLRGACMPRTGAFPYLIGLMRPVQIKSVRFDAAIVSRKSNARIKLAMGEMQIKWFRTRPSRRGVNTSL